MTARIVRNPKVLGGKPVIEGTRLSVELILSLLAAGWSRQELLDNYPGLTDDRINVCIGYAHDVVVAQQKSVQAAE